MNQVIEGKKYDTKTATKIADNYFRDGGNKFSCGRATSLYQTRKGKFFAFHESEWRDECDRIEPLSESEARRLYERLSGAIAEYEEFFGPAEEA